MRRLVLIAVFCALAFSALGQTGFPYSTTAETTWPAFVREWKPVLTWYSGLVQRAQMLSTNPTLPNVAQTIPIATSLVTRIDCVTNIEAGVTNVYYFTNTITSASGSVIVDGLRPATYTCWVDGVSCVATAYPMLTADLLTTLDEYQDALYPSFCPTSVYRSGGYAYWMDAWTNSTGGGLAWITLGGKETREGKARVFIETGTGRTLGASTNAMGWVTNGIPLWSSPLSGFGGGAFRLGSVNAEPCYYVTSFPTVNGIDFNGVYFWTESESYTDPWLVGAKGIANFYRSKQMPNVLDGSIPSASFYESDSTIKRLCGLSSDDINWFLYYLGAYDNTYFDGFAKPRGATNWFNWINGTGIGTNPVSGTISNGIAWNFRQGGSWTRPGSAQASGWLASNVVNVLRYDRASTSSYSALSVRIAGDAFNSGVGYGSTATTVSISGPLTSVPVAFAGVTNMVATGVISNGDSVTLWQTNRVLFTDDAGTWGTINKKVLDERIATLKPLRWLNWTNTAAGPGSTNFVLTGSSTNILVWSGKGQSLQDYDSALEAAFFFSTNAIGTWESGERPSMTRNGDYGMLILSEAAIGTQTQYEAKFMIGRVRQPYEIANIPQFLSNSVDVIANVNDIPTPGWISTNQFWLENPAGVDRGQTFTFTNFPSSTNSGYSFYFSPISTNWPVTNDLPAIADTISAGGSLIKGWESPKLQAIIKWEPDF